ncbi:MAG: chromosome segregation protein SMC, partial [Burkholderiaceae bacterium]|nr:chromosome segregation protein SMC [Burkholderiaceae bacterium]
MRLRQIKLAGFKSFADPIHIDVPGALVGVVGPNGCGKSNVIDAVRWVLGESKASELRGESMQDVIFNGSGNRKPAGRSSVELVFDNTEGRIQGEWGRFTELSVKRILTRDGASSYYINNQTVRRRDVQDMFLGTGLGPRAYAIIGQGMISRIIEARPEELRIFLEEAAGVSKYKERRRETENRLSDTRDNLIRIEDILRELDAQIGKLEQQAEVAQRYRDLQATHDEQQQLLWLTRKRDAVAEQERVAKDIAQRGVALEAHIAELRATERALEEARAAHYAAGDAVHAAQGEVLKINAEIGKLESEIRMIVDGRARLQAQVESQTGNRERRLRESEDLRARAAELQRQIEDGGGRLQAARAQADEQAAALPAFEETYQHAREALSGARSAAAMAEQSIDAAGAEQRNLDRQLATLAQRRERLQQERQQLGQPDDARLAQLNGDVARLQADLDAAAARLADVDQRVPQLQAERQASQEARTRDSDTLARLEARLAALRELQAKVEADEKLDPWLKSQGLESLPRLFRKLQVEPGWEAAFEAVLRERIEGLEVGRLDSLGGLAHNAPPARVAFYSTAGAIAVEVPAPAGFAKLAERVRGHDAALAAVLADWLAGVFVADDMAQALAARAQLPPGGQFVVKGGHLVSRHGVRFHAADDRKAGLLARRQEIENIERELRAQKLLVEQAGAALVRADSALRLAQESQQRERQAVERARNQLHGVQLDAVRLGELIERVKHRAGQIDGELAEVTTHEEELRAQRGEADSRFEQLDQEVAARQEAVEAARRAYEEADARLRAAREAQQRVQAEASRIQFELSSARDRAADLTQAAGVAAGDAEKFAADIEQSQLEIAKLDDSAARGGLDQWLTQRGGAEAQLAEARSRQDELAQQLRAADEKRLTLEREVQPKREKITELQLKEQAARLNADQFTQQLAEAHADEAALTARLEAQPVRANALQAEITRLAAEIEALGAVNLAALDELTTSR